MADGTDSLSQDDMNNLAAALNRYADAVERQLGEQATAGNNNRNDVRVESGRDSMWLAILAAVVAGAFAYNAQDRAESADRRMSDLRIDMRAEETQAALMNRWVAQEITAVRSYITTGKLAPMNPPPLAAPPKQERKP